MSVDTMPDSLDVSDIMVIFAAILLISLPIVIYNWINPPIWIICSIAGFIIVHGLAVLMFGPKNRPGRISFWMFSTLLLLQGTAAVGIAVKLFALKPEIIGFWDSLPMLGKMVLNPIWFAVALLIVIVMIIICAFWLIFTIESLWPQRKIYML
jgi:hypothetical protein